MLHFCWSYYWTCYRKGYRVDIWHFALLNMIFVVHIMLPFSRSNLNVFALGGLWPRTSGFITEAYLISALGYLGILIGGSLWRFNLGLRTRQTLAALVELPARGSNMLLTSRTLLLTHGFVGLTMLVAVLLYSFGLTGFSFSIGGLLLTYPAFRPIAQFAAFYSVMIASHCLARWAVYTEPVMLYLTIGIATCILFFGSRTTLLGLSILTIQVSFLRLGPRLKLYLFPVGIFFAFLAVFLLNALKQGHLEIDSAVAQFGLQTFYGNSFSDTRDFALVLSFWDGHYFYGATYLAAIISFIPRALSSFRDHYALGVVTASMAGFSPTTHPGFRVGAFGEAFLNFGIPGVILDSMAVGFIYRLVDLRMKQALKVLPAKSLRVYSYYMILNFMVVLEISVAASAVYTTLSILFASWILLRMIRFMKLETVGT